jgi:hypothetical protein
MRRGGRRELRGDRLDGQPAQERMVAVAAHERHPERVQQHHRHALVGAEQRVDAPGEAGEVHRTAP